MGCWRCGLWWWGLGGDFLNFPVEGIGGMLGGEQTPSLENAPNPGGVYWTRTRLDLRAWLQRNAPTLSELYEGAVELIYGAALPGRVRFISHAVREIRNRLPDIISGTNSGRRLSYKNSLDEIEKVWNNHKFALDGTIPSSPDIMVPPQLFRLIAILVKDHVETREKPIDAAIKLFEGCAPENRQLRDALRPVVFQWLKVTEWFMKKAHDPGKIDARYDESELQRQFELFEMTLRALARGFFTTVEELDEILEDANS